jgi:hypothetical protein
VPTFIEALPKTLSSKHSGIRWTPAETTAGGLITILTDRSATEYAVVPFGADGGRGFHLAKITAGTDAEVDSYAVFCHATDPAFDLCGCRGFQRWGGCKHRDAARALIENRWL